MGACPAAGSTARCASAVETLYAPGRPDPAAPAGAVRGRREPAARPGDARRCVWTIDLDAQGAPVEVTVVRASVRSRAQLTYEGAQAALDDGTADETLQLLREVGHAAARRPSVPAAGITLPTPEQVVEQDAHGTWTLGSRATLPVEEWNAQISLLTGMCAAQLMLDGRIGIVRTLPAADPRDVERLRLSAHALGRAVAGGGDARRRHPRARRVEPHPRRAAHRRDLPAARRGLRGVRRRGPAAPLHAAIAAPYAHTTAPLRRLVDRFVGETCLALCAGEPVPAWVRDALPGAARPDGRRGQARGRVRARLPGPGRGGAAHRAGGRGVRGRDRRRAGGPRRRAWSSSAIPRSAAGSRVPACPWVRTCASGCTQASVPERTVVFELVEPQADSASSSAEPNLERR